MTPRRVSCSPTSGSGWASAGQPRCGLRPRPLRHRRWRQRGRRDAHRPGPRGLPAPAARAAATAPRRASCGPCSAATPASSGPPSWRARTCRAVPSRVRPGPPWHRGTSLRVMSYNVHDLHDDRAAAARVVRASVPTCCACRRCRAGSRRSSGSRPSPGPVACIWAGGRLGTGGTAVLTAPRVGSTARPARRLRSASLTGRGGMPPRPSRSRRRAAPVTVVSVHLGLAGAGAAAARRGGARGAGGPSRRGRGPQRGDRGLRHRRMAGRLVLASGTQATFPAHGPTSPLDAIFASADLSTVPASERTSPTSTSRTSAAASGPPTGLGRRRPDSHPRVTRSELRRACRRRRDRARCRRAGPAARNRRRSSSWR